VVAHIDMQPRGMVPEQSTSEGWPLFLQCWSELAISEAEPLSSLPAATWVY